MIWKKQPIENQIASLNSNSVHKQTAVSATSNGIVFSNMAGSLEFGVNNDGNGFYFRIYASETISYRLIMQADHAYIQKYNVSSWETWKTLY